MKKTRGVIIEEVDAPAASPSQRAARLRRASGAERIRAISEASGTEGAESQQPQASQATVRIPTSAEQPDVLQIRPKPLAILLVPLSQMSKAEGSSLSPWYD